MAKMATALMLSLALLSAACAGDVSTSPGASSPGAAASLEGRAEALRNTLPAGFHVVVEPPFIVIGDQEESEVKAHAERTVRWAAERLKRDYFPNDPNGVFTVWLFGDKESYERNTEKFFQQKPISPYGFCLQSRRALVMNIATGGGTLVHEMVHAFMASNFPDCPAWFNEGLASLYEQSRDKEGHIWGMTNWRLEGLQQAIKARSLASFETLLTAGDEQFYNGEKGSNYAQARYLVYYLQEKGLLMQFYRNFRDHAASDPSGISTLKKTLGRNDLAAFQKEWEQFVLQLTFP